MIKQLSKAWGSYVLPLVQRPRRLQVAALCYRTDGDGNSDEKQILLITSRDTGRWVLPKGWPMRGKDGSAAAMQEAWEEAGVLGLRLSGDPVGSYTYDKIKDSGLPVPVEVLVYPVAVRELADDFPEKGERTRQWFTPAAAADLVHEPSLQALLRSL